ncbi:MAG TPA: preprotein translocase subunit SecA [Candidatus Paceibacterota bacterium]|nr:preprotein translocase subunit SecA [Candidatus Paceibacterota bacterium]
MFQLKKLFSDENKKALKALIPLVADINSYESEISNLSDEVLKGKTEEFKKRINSPADGKESLNDILPEAFAVCREASKRTLGQRHFDVQLSGGIILHQGNIAEMRTGEGKTLVATLPVYLNALEGKGVHVITVNDYLSRRDAVWMGQIYNFLGLSIGVINHDESFIYDPEHKELDKERDELGSFKVLHEFLRPVSRKEAYAADITYGTNNEFGFDFLRDNIEYESENLRQREHNFAIVDEIDSILIDEARTPLIISAPSAESGDLYGKFSEIARQMTGEKDFTVDEKMRAIQLTDDGIEKVEKILDVENIYTEKGIKYVHHLETAVRAKALFEKDKDYVVKEGEIIIVDEFTGRLQPGRRWSEGLHQAIEAKEGVEVQKESRTFASITFQNYFRMYKKLSGMTGTAITSSEEFYSVYGLHTVSVPTNVETKRIDQGDLIFQTEQGKFKAIARTVKGLHEKGQPVLIGTVSIEKNELLSAYLTQEGIPHEVLNAKKHEQEGEIIAQSGGKGKVMIATNMAGRGVDIKLGGNPGSKEQYEEVKKLGGLFVLGTERHEARRIDNQLRGRSGRQGDEGETQFFVSLEDSLMRVFASDMIKKMMGRFGIAEDEAIENRLITKSLESAQTKIEGFNFDARKHVLEYDDVMNQQRSAIYERRGRVLNGDNNVIKEELEALTAGDEEIGKIIEGKISTLGEEDFYNAVKRLILQVIDMLWVEHLEVMDYMRGSVNLRAYGQRDPLIEYKKEGLRMFKDLEESADEHILRLLPNIGGDAFARERQKVQEVHEEGSVLGNLKAQPVAAPATAPRTSDGKKIGRNDPCHCGSGKKFKKCHGK